MSAVAELTAVLIAGGMDVAEAAALVARAGAEMATPRRSKAAARTARWREKRASQTVTNRHGETDPQGAEKTSPNVTERHKPSHGDDAHISTSSNSNPIVQEQKKENKKEGQPTKRPSRIPDDWQLDQRHIDYAISKGVSPERIPTLGEKFKAYSQAASGKGSTSPDWFLKWCTWVMNDVEWNGAKNGQRPHHAPRQSGSADFFAGLAQVAADIDRDGDMARTADAGIPRGRHEFDA